MPRLVSRIWPSDPSAYGPRSERRSVRYDAYVPDPIAGWTTALPGDVAALLSEAERAVTALDGSPPAVANLEVLARRLLRAESVASSRIEGLKVSHRKLARAELEADASRDETARTVVGNVRAMQRAIEAGQAARDLAPDDVAQIHRALLEATSAPAEAGLVRTRQSWIGGNDFNPAGAEFVPPPPEEVPALLEDLCRFVNRRDLPPLVQAAVAHVQFETIHPFADGNGRVGRALVHVVLRRRGLATRFVPPVSLVLAADARAYVRGLTAFREGRPERWIAHFARATSVAVARSAELARAVGALQEAWRERAGRPRARSAAATLVELLPAHPILDAETARHLLGRSRQAVNEALNQLAAAGVLSPVSLARRNRAWEARELFDLVNEFERDVATPDGADEPGRPAPDGGR